MRTAKCVQNGVKCEVSGVWRQFCFQCQVTARVLSKAREIFSFGINNLRGYSLTTSDNKNTVRLDC